MNIYAIVAAASDVNTVSSVKTEEDVRNIPICQSQKPDLDAQINKEQVEKFFRIVDAKIAYLNEQIAIVKSPEDKEELQMQLGILQDLKDKRERFADFKISDDGQNVTFTIKDFVTAETIKDLYFLKDGVFRPELKAEYDKGIDNGVFPKTEMFLGFIPITVLDYEASVLTVSKEYTIPADMLKDESALDEYLATEVQRQRELNN